MMLTTAKADKNARAATTRRTGAIQASTTSGTRASHWMVGHADLTCDDCHSSDPFSDENDTACVSCHLEDDNHDRHFGDTCDSCHVTADWDKPAFDHDIDTDHPLVGAHEEIECVDCHLEPIFDVALQGACHDCHADDDPHEGEQGTSCTDCHNEAGWQEDLFFDHDLTRFPLLGNHADEECESCHESHVFRDAPTECIDCHQDDDPHGEQFDGRCGGLSQPGRLARMAIRPQFADRFRLARGSPDRRLRQLPPAAADNDAKTGRELCRLSPRR